MTSMTVSTIALLFILPFVGAVAQQEPAAPASPVEKVQITDVKVGKGPVVADGDVVAISYSVWGDLSKPPVDATSDKKPPLAFMVGKEGIIAGMQEGVRGMKAGGKRKLTVPPSLGYGQRDMGVFGPNTTLTFEIELHRIDKKGAAGKLAVENVKAGTGSADVKVGDTVAFHYTGTFLNGVKFDSSRDRNEPLVAQAGMKNLIEGFDKTLLGMKIGEVRRVTIPYMLAYGEKGNGTIPPFSALQFEIEVVKIGK